MDSILTERYQNELDELIDDVTDKREKNVIRKVVRNYLRPNPNVSVPVIELGNEFDLSAISRVFTTINTTGKLLTSFELVVAILYPHGVSLEEDVVEYKSKYSYYNNMDKNGEVLLQVIAMLAGKSPKKSDLPKNIDHTAYETYGEAAAKSLNEVGELLTSSLGVGLDVTDKLIPYDAIFAPMALALKYINENIKGHTEVSSAKQKLKVWFVASALMQRYQEGVHNKQAKYFEEVKYWIENPSKSPGWIKEAYISRNVKHASPSGAIGKLVTCLVNSKRPYDPVQDEEIGFRDGISNTQIHHIFPTKWASKGMKGYERNRVEINLSLNTMLLSSKTNGNWLNFSPKNQVENAIKVAGSEKSVLEKYSQQMIGSKCVEILRKPEVVVGDYGDFIEQRYLEIVKQVSNYGIKESGSGDGEDIELESPSILED